jgi:hypothetical protein
MPWYSFMLVIWSYIVMFLDYVWQLFSEWLHILIAPVFYNDLLWISIPIWLNWFFAEFFQEKRGTSYGNAISNGAVPLFVGIDWARYITNALMEDRSVDWLIYSLKYAICGAIAVYGFTIIVLGIRGHVMTRKIGRIREVTYVLLMFTPVVYGVIDLSWSFLIESVLFFFLWYYIIEWIDRRLPDPKVYRLDQQPQYAQRQYYQMRR